MLRVLSFNHNFVFRSRLLEEIVFVGLGLHDEMGISLRALNEIRTACAVFMELYTSLLPNFSKERFQKISGKKPRFVSRRELEEQNGNTYSQNRGEDVDSKK